MRSQGGRPRPVEPGAACWERGRLGRSALIWSVEKKRCQGLLPRFRGLGCPGYRLPTEAEWEVAARAGTETPIYGGGLELRGENDAPGLDGIAWYGGNSGVSYGGGHDCSEWLRKQNPAQRRCGTHPVRGKEPNGWQLYDMLGNVLEWTTDTWQDRIPATPKVDPLSSAPSFVRVIRGGSWSSDARVVRAAYRYCSGPDFRYDALGFRLARSEVSSASEQVALQLR